MPLRHGLYYEWGHMRGGMLVHRLVSPEQAVPMSQAITYRKLKNLLRCWEAETDRCIDAQSLQMP